MRTGLLPFFQAHQSRGLVNVFCSILASMGGFNLITRWEVSLVGQPLRIIEDLENCLYTLRCGEM